LTGASGFVVQRLVLQLADRGTPVRALVLRPGTSPRHEAIEEFVAGDLTTFTDWSAALQGCTHVIHLAARVHIMRDAEPEEALEKSRHINVDVSRQLALAAAAGQVERFVFVSTVKVCGEERDTPYREVDAPTPATPYGQSKWEAEQALLDIQAQQGLSVAIVRPPLVYGPGVRANFRALMALVDRFRIWPFGRANNRRSMIFVDNLTHLLQHCARHPDAHGQVFLASDGEDLSTAALVRCLAAAMDRTLLSLPLTGHVFAALAPWLGLGGIARRLLGSLSVDTSRVQQRLDWQAPFTIQQGIEQTVQWYLRTR